MHFQNYPYALRSARYILINAPRNQATALLTIDLLRVEKSGPNSIVAYYLGEYRHSRL